MEELDAGDAAGTKAVNRRGSSEFKSKAGECFFEVSFMPNYRLLQFRGHRLLSSEVFDAENPIDAIQEAAGRPHDGLAELWLGSSRIAVFRPRKNADGL